MEDERIEAAILEMRLLDRKYRKACSQVVLLQQRMEDKKVRYERLRRRGRDTLMVRMELATLEGVKSVFREYVRRKAQEMEEVQEVLVEAGLIEDCKPEELHWTEGV